MVLNSVDIRSCGNDWLNFIIFAICLTRIKQGILNQSDICPLVLYGIGSIVLNFNLACYIQPIHWTEGFLFQDLLNLSQIIEDKEKPRIVRQPESIATTVGQSALFVCLVDGNPAPKVQWKVTGVSVSEAHFGQTIKAPRGSILRVPNILTSYNGAQVTCIATNALGRAEHSAELTVYPDPNAVPAGFPQFLNSFSVIVAKKNGDVELECRTSGDPPPEISWFRNSVPIDLSENRFKLMDTGNLRISNLVEDDEGKYECLARNDKGARLSSGDELLVRENVENSLHLIAPSTRQFRPHFTNIPPSRQIVPPGGRLVLTCTAVGAPIPSVVWYRGNRQMHEQSERLQQPGTARISLLDLSESLNVTCVAESSMGRVYHDVQIVVKNLPEPPGAPMLLDVGSTHAQIAFEPCRESEHPSPITTYLAFWIETDLLSNDSIAFLPSTSQTMLEYGPFVHEGQIEPSESVYPKFNLIRAVTKELLQGVDGRVILPTDSKTPQSSTDVRRFPAVVTSLTQLKPYSNYSIWIRGLGSDGDASLPSPVVYFQTQEIAPSSPPRNVQAKAISNAAVTLFWDPPQEANGKIRAYRVYHTNQPNKELVFWDTNIVDVYNTSLEPQRNSNGQVYILSHLIANETYLIRVSAVNAKGEGPPSDAVVVIVRPGLIGPVRNFKATVKSSHEIELFWSLPSELEQSVKLLKEYRLQYAPVADNIPEWITNIEEASTKGKIRTKAVEATSKKVLVTSLRPDTRYIFSLAALSSVGPGVSAFAFAKTDKYVPSEPRNLLVQAISHTELDVRWQSPETESNDTFENDKESRILYYDLSWRASTESGGQLNPGTETHWPSQHAATVSPGLNRRLVPASSDASTSYAARIANLDPSTFYVVQVSAVAASGAGKRALSELVKTWNAPAPAPKNLRLFSQILPPSGTHLPPQVLIKVSWELPLENNDYYHRAGALFQISWRLILSGSNEPVNRGVRSLSTTDRWLYWIDPNQEVSHDQNVLIPAKFVSGETNKSGTSWNAPAGLFLLGMSYEFKVAAIGPNQLGNEAVQRISLEGSAPTGSPTGLTTTLKHDTTLLNWSPPDWTHRHGYFVAYELRCETIHPTQSGIRQLNVTTKNSKVDWPKHKELSTKSLIAWPMARVDLSSPVLGGDLLSQDIECRVRAFTKYGASPWSNKVDVYAKEHAAVPMPPKQVHAIILPKENHLVVNWAMPSAFVQTLMPPNVLVPFQPNIVYRRFAVYISPIGAKNWTRYLTNGPVTEFSLSPIPGGESTVQVRVSSIGNKGHEGTWSEVVYARPVSADRAIQVEGLSCLPIYDNEYSRWMLQLQWNNPKWLDNAANFKRLLHYRVNYSWSTKSRELSLSVDRKNHQRTVRHHIPGLLPRTAYNVSVRSVIWFDTLNVGNSEPERYGLEQTVHCPLPDKPKITVEAPWIVKDLSKKHTKNEEMVVGCAVYNLTRTAANFQLLAQSFDLSRESIQLAIWSINSSRHQTTKQFFRVQLSETHVKENRWLRDDTVLGLKLVPRKSYALSLRVCPEDTKRKWCIQSLWTKHVGTNLAPPTAPEPNPIRTADLDRSLWHEEPDSVSSSAMQSLPSDDATARGPAWSSMNGEDALQHNKFNSGKSNDQRNAPGPDSRSASQTITPTKSHRISILVSAVFIVVFFFGLGIVISVFIIYRRRVTKAWVGSCPSIQPKYALMHWTKASKHSPKHSLAATLNLSHIQGPPSGISSIAANFPPGLTTCNYYDDTMDPRVNGTLCSGNDSFDLFGSSTQFDSLPANHHFDTPNGNVSKVLQRTDSLNYRLMSSPSPNFGPLARPVTTEMISTYKSIPVGSLKSASRSVVNGYGDGNGVGLDHIMAARMLNSASRPIEIDNLVQHVERLKADNGRLMSAEFESIDPGGQFTWEHSNRPVNRSKNRYANVIAYDHSRVVLQRPALSEHDSDYINANYLDGFKSLNAYIATQGPLPNTVNDFWRMVWEQRCAIIVSMTRLEERARVKCEQYWPSNSLLTHSMSPSRFASVHVNESRSLLIRDAENNALTQTVAPFRQNMSPNEPELGVVFANSLSHQSFLTENSCSTAFSEATFGEINVAMTDVTELAYYTIRTLVLRKIGSPERREVRQMQFTAWPDHGVPNHPAPLLMFLRRVKAECPPDSGPMVVHCSAGVGRTGAFILLDILLEQMRQERVVDVFGWVNRLRAQRNFMVQTEEQYAFVYEALVEAAASGNTELTVQQLAAHWSRLTSKTFDGGVMRLGLEVEFSQLASQSELTNVITSDPTSVGLLSPVDPISNYEDDRTKTFLNSPCIPSIVSSQNNRHTALLKVNLHKNRDPDVIPHEANRVALKAVRGVEGSDYVNASYIDGYRSRAAYIATQAPMPTTRDDFWRMIWETGSCVIVRLEDSTEMNDSSVYWPTSHSARHGFLIVDPISTYTMTSYVMRELRLTDTRDGTTRTVRIFDNTAALERMRDLASHWEYNATGTNTAYTQVGADFKQRSRNLSEVFLDLVTQVHKSKEQFGVDGPITVHCNLGAGRTGIFLTLSIILGRMRYEGVVDMFQTVKLLRWQRPALVRSLFEYAFCYATALEYVESFERYAT